MQKKVRGITSIEIQIQHWGGNRQLSVEGIAVEYFANSVDPGSNKKNHNFIPIQVMTINKIHMIHVLVCFIY